MNPISIRYFTKVEMEKGNTNRLAEMVNNAISIVLLTTDGSFLAYAIESIECEREAFYFDLLFSNMEAFKEVKNVFDKPQAIFIEDENGELIQLKYLLDHSVIEIAEHSDFDTVFYNPTTLRILE